MLPNEKKNIDELRAVFGDVGANRITPKDLRDLIVSSYGSENVSTLVDSQVLDENHEFVIAIFDTDLDYLQLPLSSGNDATETPFKNKVYTIFNASPYTMRLVPMGDDVFNNNDTEIRLGVNSVAKCVNTGERWIVYSAGQGDFDGSGSESTGWKKQEFYPPTVEEVILFTSGRWDAYHLQYALTAPSDQLEPFRTQYGRMEVTINNGVPSLAHEMSAEEIFEPIEYEVIDDGTNVKLIITSGNLGLVPLAFAWKEVHSLKVGSL